MGHLNRLDIQKVLLVKCNTAESVGISTQKMHAGYVIAAEPAGFQFVNAIGSFFYPTAADFSASFLWQF